MRTKCNNSIGTDQNSYLLTVIMQQFICLHVDTNSDILMRILQTTKQQLQANQLSKNHICSNQWQFNRLRLQGSNGSGWKVWPNLYLVNSCYPGVQAITFDRHITAPPLDDRSIYLPINRPGTKFLLV